MDALLLARLNIAIVAAIIAAIGAVLAWLAGREVKRAQREGTETEITEAVRQQRRAAAGVLLFGLLAGLCFVLPVFGVP